MLDQFYLNTYYDTNAEYQSTKKWYIWSDMFQNVAGDVIHLNLYVFKSNDGDDTILKWQIIQMWDDMSPNLIIEIIQSFERMFYENLVRYNLFEIICIVE